MTRVFLLLVSALAIISCTATALAAPGLPPGWSHAEINITIKGEPHTLILDRGRVTTVWAKGIVLKERDGSVVTIRVNAKTKVRLDGTAASLGAIEVRARATTERIDGGPARLVRAFSPTR